MWQRSKYVENSRTPMGRRGGSLPPHVVGVPKSRAVCRMGFRRRRVAEHIVRRTPGLG